MFIVSPRFRLLVSFLALAPHFLAGCAARAPAPAGAPPPAVPAALEPETTNQKPKTDLYGDPLPPGAIARMGTVRLWHGGPVPSIAFSPEGKTLASGSKDDTIRLWEVATGKELLKLSGHENGVYSVAFSPDGKTLASAESKNGTIRLWDVATGKERLKLTGHEGWIFSIAFSPDGKMLASGSIDNTIRLWEVVTGKELRELTGHKSVVESVVFSPDGKMLASGSGDKTIRLWEIATGKALRKLVGHEGQVWSVAFSPDGKTLASGSADKTIHLWNVATGEEVLRLRGHVARVFSVAFSPDGKMLASGSEDWTTCLWEVASGKELLKIEGHDGEVFAVAFSPDGKTLASGSGDGTVLVWDVSAVRGTPTASVGSVKQRTLEDLWGNLAGTDAVAAYAAIGELSAAGAGSVAFIKDQFKRGPWNEANAKQVAQLIAKLDDDDVSVREKATVDLKELGMIAEPLLRGALEKGPSAEAKLRIGEILAPLERPLPILAGESLRRHRAIQVIERIGSPAAREVLDLLAKESPSLRERQEARAACERLKR